MASVRRFLLFPAILVLVGLVAGCGGSGDVAGPGDSVVRETIGNSGGTIEITDEASLSIPQGALSSDVDFTMTDAGSNHTPMVQTRDLKSPVYRIGPSGTTFSEAAELTLYYDEDDLDGLNPGALIIYADHGDGWTPVPTTIDRDSAALLASITSLSDFVVTAPASEEADGVYAVFEVVRMINYAQDPVADIYSDLIVARFDSVVNMSGVVQPMHPDSVTCNGEPLVWEEEGLGYYDESEEMEFLDLGAIYRFVVTPSPDVPALDESITMVDVNPTIRNIRNLDPVPLTGFTLQWDGTSAGTVDIAFVTNELEVLQIEAPNTGSYTFTEQELSGLNPGIYYLDLGYYSMRSLTAVNGYDPNSHIAAYTLSGKLVNMVDTPGVIGPEGGIVLLGDDGRLVIPAGSLTETTIFTTSINSSPPAAPEGYITLSPVYTVGPSGTTFSPPATIELSYDPDDLDGAPESGVVILKHDGVSWTVLDSDVDEDQVLVEADVSSLSDFVAAVPEPGDGVYAVVQISRTTTSMYGMDITTDGVTARFDSVVDEDSVDPLEAGGVTFGAWEMTWDGDGYQYFDLMSGTFLTPGAEYDLVVTESDDVPALDIPVTVMNSTLLMTGLGDDPVLSLDGFTLNWDGSALGSTVNIVMLVHGQFDGLEIDVPNTGSYTFSSAELSGLVAGDGQIAIMWEQDSPLVGQGYHSLSHVNQYTQNNAFVTFE
jgi:hypothetical protein